MNSRATYQWPLKPILPSLVSIIISYGAFAMIVVSVPLMSMKGDEMLPVVLRILSLMNVFAFAWTAILLLRRHYKVWRMPLVLFGLLTFTHHVLVTFLLISVAKLR